MWQFILIGDVVIMGIMIAMVIWMSFKGDKKAQAQCMRIPLEDEK